MLAKVVRTTETGFAVRFLDLDKRLRRILEDTLQIIESEAAVDPERGLGKD